jgi:hypothetical protein
MDREAARELNKLLYMDVTFYDNDSDEVQVKIHHSDILNPLNDGFQQLIFKQKMPNGLNMDYEISTLSEDNTFDNAHLVLHDMAGDPLASFSRGSDWNCIIHTNKHMIELEDWVIDDA